eukprot:CAMPEP_0203683780 /NCGR_PEP_ID=MMETSP0090-20130426/47698_1 /ASSEMBLY_ACC=CAM_ASM_001088 /TAXON_ID=426623 /ORGANISM="Chaetoceros affinis, Strain CCMP159" /LENGTH=179 /DNA_ID=CAMNT_0050552935 /DNA_START=1 /DNA_END=537 /DNA_ORIENTATION=-
MKSCQGTRILFPSAFWKVNNYRYMSSLVNVENVRKWTSQNEEIAREILRVPTMAATTTTTTTTANSSEGDCCTNLTLFDYLKWRKWDSVTKYANGDTAENKNDEENFKTSLALLSHTLTFPLTLANHMHEFIPQPSSSILNPATRTNEVIEEEEGNNSRTLRLCCVGPRAESSLPLDKW